MFEAIVKSVIFIILFSLCGYFFVLLPKKNWFMPTVNALQGVHRVLQIEQRLLFGGRSFLAVVRCGNQEFLDVKLSSGIRVLMPLPKTDWLVEWVITQWLKQSPNRLLESRNILGLGTRSVAIAAALVKGFSMNCILAVDQS